MDERKLVLVLVPCQGIPAAVTVRTAKAATLLAVRKGFLPVCPMLWGATFLSEAEAEWELEALCRGEDLTLLQSWLLLADSLLLAFAGEDIDLDRVTWAILNANERSLQRKPVLHAMWNADVVGLSKLNRGEVLTLLRANVCVGLTETLS